jgi:cytochrome P450
MPDTSIGDAVSFDPFAPGYFDDPYPQYAALRSFEPVYFEPRGTAYILTRYADVSRLVRDRSMVVEISQATATPRIMAEMARNAAVGAGADKWMVFRDGEDHARLRRLVSQVFTPKAVASWHERTVAVVEQLLATATEHDPFDVITQFARPLPALIISEMLGIPAGDMPMLLDWSHSLIRTIESLNTPEQEQAVLSATNAMVEYLRGLLVEKRARPADDILTALLAAEDSGDHLSLDEVVAQVVMLYFAGHETTENLIGNGLTHLFAHPEELARLRADPSLDGQAIEELLRFDAPVQFTRRIAVEPLELHGTVLPVGADLLLGLGAANRDPDKWGPDGDVLDLTRPNANEHMTFSGGAHHCLGASLARLEGRIALPGLIRRFPHMTPAYDRPAWAHRMVLRGVEQLPVHLQGA